MGQQVKSISEQLKDAQFLAKSSDASMSNLAKQEIEHLKAILIQQQAAADPTEAIIEIRAGTGGEEAELFAMELSDMYIRYSESKGWNVKMIVNKSTNLGGTKLVVLKLKGITGQSPYTDLKYESGVHRVQRIPITEKKGRVHTSAATVAVLPVSQSSEININLCDLRVDVYRAAGHGGQGVNTTDSAVRITHLPTGIVVTCQDERSQIKNRQKAISTLQAKLQNAAAALSEMDISDERRSQIGTGDRSEKIRTYNFPQDRITDHRINKNFSRIEAVLAGNMNDIVNQVKDHFTLQAETESV